jgi:hypothetical protein
MNRRVPTVVNLLLLAACTAAAVYWALQLTTGGAPKEPLVSVPTADRVARTQPLDMVPVARLFGAGGTVAAPANIRLSGIIAVGASGKGTALLSVGDGPAMAYRAGDTIDETTRLGAVHADRVVLDRSGAPIELRLPERSAPEGIAPARTAREPNPRDPLPRPPGRAAPTPDKSALPRGVEWRR